MESQPLRPAAISTVPDSPGMYIIRCCGEILSVMAVKRLKEDLGKFWRGVQGPFAPSWVERNEPYRRTEATTYVKERHFETFPPEELTFEYTPRSTEDEAKLLRRAELQDYREQYGRLPPLVKRV